MYMGDDLAAIYLPLRYCYSHALAAGDSFLWSPQLFCGFYLQAEQAGMTHPLHWLLYRTLPLTEAFNLEFLFSYPWMFAGVFLMLRRWRFERYARLFRVLAFTFGGYNIMHFMHLHLVAIVSQIPWLILLNDVVLCTADRRRLALAQLGVALLTASQILLVHPQHVGSRSLPRLSLSRGDSVIGRGGGGCRSCCWPRPWASPWRPFRYCRCGMPSPHPRTWPALDYRLEFSAAPAQSGAVMVPPCLS